MNNDEENNVSVEKVVNSDGGFVRPSRSELDEKTKLIKTCTVWQIATLRKDGCLTIPCVLADVYMEPYIAITWAMKLNKKDPENYYWVIERHLTDTKFAYEGVDMPKDVAENW